VIRFWRRSATGWAGCGGMVVGSVGSSAVVVSDVGPEYHTHVPLIEDQHAVGEFGSEGADESFGETVRPGAPRRNSVHADSVLFQDGIVRLFGGRGWLERRGPGCVIQCPRSGGGRQPDDLVPGGESGAHLVSVLGCGESVAAGPEVR
jgi:hypothetical protein